MKSMLQSFWATWRRTRLYRRCLASPARALILRYHSIGDPERVREYLDPGLSLPPERFAAQLSLLGRHFDFATLDELESVLADSTGRRRPVVFITFDDGYRDNHDEALPRLLEAGARATFYVTTGPLESGRGLWISELARLVPRLPERRQLTRRLAAMTAREREEELDRLARAAGRSRGEGLADSFMNPEHLRGLAKAGMLVGAHTRTHPHLARLDPDHHQDEVAGSRADLERILGTSVEHFAYPNPGGGGAVPEAARRAVERAGFRTAVSSNPGPLENGTDRLHLPRIGVYAGRQEALLFRLIERTFRA